MPDLPPDLVAHLDAMADAYDTHRTRPTVMDTRPWWKFTEAAEYAADAWRSYRHGDGRQPAEETR